MSDILTRIKFAYTANDAAQVIKLMPELMNAVGKTVFELPCKSGDMCYFVNWAVHEFYQVQFRRISYSENHFKIFLDFLDLKSGYSWRTDIDDNGHNVFLTESSAREALEGKHVSAT